MQVPTNWTDITIGRFIAAYEVSLSEYDNALDKEVAFVAALTNVSEDKVLDLPRKDFYDIVKHLQFVADLDSIGTKFPKWFAIKGRAFKPMTDMRKATAGQYIDLAHFTKGEGVDVIKNLHNILAVICLPFFQRRYEGHRHKKLAAFFHDNLTMDIAYPIAVFFCNLWQHSTPAMLACLENQILTKTEKAQRGILSSLN